MKTITTCLLCGGRKFKFLFKNRDRMHEIPGEFSLWECSCGIVFLNPQPDEIEIARYYPEEYGPYHSDENRQIGSSIVKRLEHAYYSSGGNSLLWEFLCLPFRYGIRGAVVRKGASLLDVGSGSGIFLEKMKRYGMDVYGVDFSRNAVLAARARGLNVFHGSLQQAQFPSEHFDVITLHHVFEHLHDPIVILKELRRLLKNDGMLLIAVPNMHSLGYKIFRQYWVHLETPRHLFQYSKETLQALAGISGFKIVKTVFQSSNWNILVSINHWFNEQREKKISAVESPIVKNIFLRFSLIPVATLLSITPWADCVEVWLQKVDEP